MTATRYTSGEFLRQQSVTPHWQDLPRFVDHIAVGPISPLYAGALGAWQGVSFSSTGRNTSSNTAVIDYQAISAAFTLDNAPGVFAFLEKHPRLIPVLLDAAHRLRGFFPYEPLHVSVNQDPEYPDEWRVIISVSTTREVDDAMQRLDAFDDVWLLTLAGEACELLLVTLAFL